MAASDATARTVIVAARRPGTIGTALIALRAGFQELATACRRGEVWFGCVATASIGGGSRVGQWSE
jgi:hypothetical protein